MSATVRASGVALVLGFGLMAGASPAQAKNEPEALTPSSPWNVHYGETKCRLARTFGEGDDLHALILDQHSPSASAGMTVAGPSFRRFKGRKETEVHFSDTASPFTSEPFKGDIGSQKHALIFSNVYFGGMWQQDDAESETGGGIPAFLNLGGIPQLNSEYAADITYLTFSQGHRNVRLETGSLGKAFEALNTCTQAMVSDWGFDVEKQMTVAKRPVIKNLSSVTKRIQRSYPTGALNRGEGAIIRMRVTVDETGTVEDCVLNDMTLTKSLESPACREMRFAEFDPAIDKYGNPIVLHNVDHLSDRALTTLVEPTSRPSSIQVARLR